MTEKCVRCGIAIPDQPEEATYEMLLCDTCYCQWEFELAHPWIWYGVCVNEGTHICNLGYACDGCPYNKEVI